MLLASIDPACELEPTSAALRTKGPNEHRCDYVATTLIDEYNSKQIVDNDQLGSTRTFKRRNRKKGRNIKRSNVVGKADRKDDSDRSDSDIEGMDRALAAAALRSVKRSKNNQGSLCCNFCERTAHMAENCFINPDNSNKGQSAKFFDWLNASGCKAKSREPRKSSNGSDDRSGKLVIFGATIEEISVVNVKRTRITPPDDTRSYADSTGTPHCFHTKSVFIPRTI